MYVGTLQGEEYLSGQILSSTDYFNRLPSYIELDCSNLASMSIRNMQKYAFSDNIFCSPLKLYDLTGTNRVTSLRDNEIAIASSNYARLMMSYLDKFIRNEDSGSSYELQQAFKPLKTQLDDVYRDSYGIMNVSTAISTFKTLNQFMEKYSIPAPTYTVTYSITEETKTVSLAAIYYATDGYGTAYFSDNLYEPYTDGINAQKRYLTETVYTFSPDAIIDGVFIPKSAYSGKLNEILDATYEIGADSSSFAINNGIMYSVDLVNSTVSTLKKISLGLWLGFTAFAILLMFAFISASISAKKKDIGILRAIGARSADVFLIFWAEALMLTLMCLILSIAVTAIVCPVLNKALLESDIVNISVMTFGPLNALLMAVVAVVTATIATVVPVLIYSKKPPVDSIRAL